MVNILNGAWLVHQSSKNDVTSYLLPYRIQFGKEKQFPTIYDKFEIHLKLMLDS